MSLLMQEEKRAARSRWLMFGLALFGLAIMGVWTLLDSDRLAHNQLLHASDYAAYAVCHRITDRSFMLAGRQVPLCARCTGIYLGFMLTFIVFALMGRKRFIKLPPTPILVCFGLLLALMGVDGVNSYTHFFPNFPHVYTPKNWLRLVTGMGAGLTMGAILWPALMQSFWQKTEWKSAVPTFRIFFILIAFAASLVLLVLSDQPLIVYILAITSALGVVLALGAVNTVFYTLLFKIDGRAKNWGQASFIYGVGILLAIGEIALISMWRFGWTGTMTGLPGL